MKSITSYISETEIVSSLDDYILEGLKINSKSKVYKDADSYTDDDFLYPVRKKSGEEYQWFTGWKYLMKNGPMSKHDLLTDFDLQPTSYATQFAQLSKKNIIVPSHGKLEAKHQMNGKKYNKRF